MRGKEQRASPSDLQMHRADVTLQADLSRTFQTPLLAGRCQGVMLLEDALHLEDGRQVGGLGGDEDISLILEQL